MSVTWYDYDTFEGTDKPFLARGTFRGPYPLASNVAICIAQPEGIVIEADLAGHYEVVEITHWSPLSNQERGSVEVLDLILANQAQIAEALKSGLLPLYNICCTAKELSDFAEAFRYLAEVIASTRPLVTT